MKEILNMKEILCKHERKIKHERNMQLRLQICHEDISNYLSNLKSSSSSLSLSARASKDEMK